MLAAIDAVGLPAARAEARDHREHADAARSSAPSTCSRRCARTGVGLHLDDFGTGYSSLTALHRFPVDALKIDRSFVATISEEDGNDVIVRSTVALAHSLGLPVIAEGIEDPDQLERLRVAGLRVRPGLPVLAGR